LSTPDRPEQLYGISRGELFPAKSAHKAPASNLSPRFQPPEDAQQISPGNIKRLTLEQFAKNDSIPLQQLGGDGFDCFPIDGWILIIAVTLTREGGLPPLFSS